MDGPGPAAVKASVDEGMSSREPSSYAWCTGPVVGVRDRSRLGECVFGPLTNSRNVSDLVHAGSSIMTRTSSWARNSPRDQLLASPF